MLRKLKLNACKFVCYLSVSFFSQNALADLEQLTVQDGLSSNQATCVYKDNRGFVWVGTYNGLNRYDGHEVTIFKHLPGQSSGLSDNGVTAITEDKWGNIWIGTNNGLNKFSWYSNTIKWFFQEHGLPNNDIRALKTDSGGSVWIGTKNGLGKINSKNARIERVNPGNFDFAQKSCILSIEMCQTSGKLWLGTFYGGLVEYDIRSNLARKIDVPNMNLTDIKSLKLINDNILYIGSGNQGVLKLLRQENKIERVMPHRRGDVHALEHDDQGNIWISQGNSVVKYNEKDGVKLLKSDDGIFEGIITEIFHDNEGLTWLTSDVGGIYMFNEKPYVFEQYHHEMINDKGTLPETNYVSAIDYGVSGDIWIGTYGNGLFRYDSNIQLVRHITVENSPLPSNTIKSIAVGQNGTVWIGTAIGLVCYWPATGSWQGLSVFKNGLWHNSIETLLRDRDNNIWIGAMGGLNKYEADKNKVMRYSVLGGFPKYKTNCMMEDKRGHIWLGTYHGLYVYDPKAAAFKKYNKGVSPRRLSNDKILGLAQDKSGDIWIGTKNGLNRYNLQTHEFTWFFERNGLVNNVVSSLIVDQANNLWVSTPSGVSVMKIPSLEITNFNHNDGLRPNARQAKISKDNLLVIGDQKSGFYAFNPDSIRLDTEAPQVYILGVSSMLEGKKVIPENKKITFAYADRNIRIHYAAPNYLSSEKNRFMYSLKGLESNWNYASYHKMDVTYNNLTPGTYEFCIKPIHCLRKYATQNGDSVLIEILPPWWKAWWMYIIYTGFFIGIITVSLYLRKRRNILLSSFQLAKEDKYLSEEKAKLHHQADQQKLKFFVNISHEFRTPLTLITVPLENLLSESNLSDFAKQQLNYIKTNTQRLQNLINELIDFRKLALNKKKIHYQNMEFVFFMKSIFDVYAPLAKKNKIDYQLNTEYDELKIKLDDDILDKIMHNLLSNAFKNTPVSGFVEVGLKRGVDNTIIITISNSGEGIAKENIEHIFDRFFYVPSSNISLFGSTGIGLSIVKEYVDLLGGDIKVHSEPGDMTTFSLVLPYKEADDLSNSDSVFKQTQQKEYDGKLIKELSEEDDVGLLRKQIDNDKKRLMIVEDNPEIRELIYLLFHEQFEVLQAENGKIGLEMALSNVPDIIISDIMMPEMDGIMFCASCKDHEITSHIPIVLLTAKTGEKPEVDGYNAGADAYVSKPFSSSAFWALVHNLIDNREKLKNIYSDGHFHDMDYLIKNPSDKRFIEKVEQVLQNNLTDENFNVAELSRELFLSTSQLHRKFKGFVGQSPGDYIRNYRINMGARLLSKTNLTIAEITHRIGLKYAQNFSRTFLQLYGISPTEYRKAHGIKDE